LLDQNIGNLLDIDSLKEVAYMINATRIRPGMIIIKDGELYRVMSVDHVTPGKGNAFIRAQLRSLKVGNQIEARYASQEKVEKAVLDQREMEYLYSDGELFYFMDTSTYEQIHLDKETLGDAINYLLPNTKVIMNMFEGNPVGVNLPQTVDLKVVEAEPAVKRATASAQMKNAVLETGMRIRVPAFVEAGDVVRVDTETGEYVERV